MSESRQFCTAEFLGKGRQGTVFKVTPKNCVKIFHRIEDAENETAAYRLAQSSPFFPKMHRSGPQFIIMDYVEGISLTRYLKDNRDLPETVTEQILSAFREMKRIGFSRIDAACFHILINKQNGIKIIDLVHALTKTYTFPFAFFHGMKRLGMSDLFWEQAKKIAPDLHNEWKLNRFEGS